MNINRCTTVSVNATQDGIDQKTTYTLFIYLLIFFTLEVTL